MRAFSALFLSLVLASAARGESAAELDADKAHALPVATLDCRTLLQAGGEERDLLLALFHGYVAGKAGAAEMDTVKMSFTTDRVIDHCIDNPDDSVLAAFAASSEP